MDLRLRRYASVGLLALIMLTATGLQPAHAVDKSRVFTWLIFFSGLGSSAAGAIIQGQANETYDSYLHTAVQAEMDKLVDDYDQKHKQSIIASRTGIGLVVGAILISLIDAANIPQPEVQKTSPLFGSEYNAPGAQTFNADTQNGDIILVVGRRF